MWGNPTLTTQKMKFSIKDFFSKCEQIGSHFPLRISLVNVNKSEGNCGFVHIYYGNP